VGYYFLNHEDNEIDFQEIQTFAQGLNCK
jgi:hypothetical protein